MPKGNDGDGVQSRTRVLRGMPRPAWPNTPDLV